MEDRIRIVNVLAAGPSRGRGRYYIVTGVDLRSRGFVSAED
jgi:hypothetical protein